ncbi:MAG: leucine-rich repeat domain-containing protein [Bacteroidaceae bacterium]|nr:leucine-rich repeat domain-containing protein [Bacteroidaceae bacterium]
MKKFFYAFIAVVLFLSSCTPSPDRVIMYKTNDNKPIAFGEDKFGNAKLVSNEYSEEEKCFVAVFDKAINAIGNSAFSYCSSLTSITIPNSVKEIGYQAFEYCTALKHLCIEDGDNPLSLGYDEFNKEDRGKSLFYDCPLESIYLGRNIVCKNDYNYGFSPFCEKERLRTVTIGNSVNRIDYMAFAHCRNLISLTIQNGVKEIGNQAFKNCPALTSIEIPNSVTSIEREAFSWCVSLTNIRIPKSAKVDETAFEGCDNLKINY